MGHFALLANVSRGILAREQSWGKEAGGGFGGSPPRPRPPRRVCQWRSGLQLCGTDGCWHKCGALEELSIEQKEAFGAQKVMLWARTNVFRNVKIGGQALGRPAENGAGRVVLDVVRWREGDRAWRSFFGGGCGGGGGPVRWGLDSSDEQLERLVVVIKCAWRLHLEWDSFG